MDEDRELAQKHWAYTEKIILQMLDLAKTLYIEAMIHGIGHGREDILEQETDELIRKLQRELKEHKEKKD